jgi:DNA-binding HxlR family transcriptional regulator
MKRSAKPRADSRRRRSGCPIARALDLVGDKWTLLIVRDLLLRGKTTYGDMANSPERIPTSVLADRLRRLIDAGLIDRSPYQDNPVRYAYRLTDKGAALGPVLDEIVRWGDEHAP